MQATSQLSLTISSGGPAFEWRLSPVASPLFEKRALRRRLWRPFPASIASRHRQSPLLTVAFNSIPLNKMEYVFCGTVVLRATENDDLAQIDGELL